jgi:Xaa-Pro aminopeptidase
MSKHNFELSEFEDRQARVRAAMEKEGLDLLIVVHPVNMAWLTGTGHKGYQEFQCLFFTLDPRPMTIITRLADAYEVKCESLAADVRGWGGLDPEDPVDIFKAVMKEKGYTGRRIGLEVPRYYMGVDDYLKIRDFLGNSLVMEANRLVEDLKLVKSPAEIAYIRKAVTIADAGLARFAEKARAGMTEHQMAAEIYYEMMSLNGDLAASPINLASGPRTAYGHGLPSERKVGAGDFIMVEFGGAYRRYGTTVGRHACAGEPSNRMQELHDLVLASCDACINAIRPGVPAVEPHIAARKVIEDAGLIENCWHTTGYGIAPGYPPSWGESVDMFGDSEYVLEEGMVLSVEPPVFVPEDKLGARLIDNVLVTRDGAELLSSNPRDIVVI